MYSLKIRSMIELAVQTLALYGGIYLIHMDDTAAGFLYIAIYTWLIHSRSEAN